MIVTPGHGALPSGHATEAFAAALVLWELIRDRGKKPYGDPGYGVQLMGLAARIAVNRTVAGVHFPIDTVAGALLGLTLGDYFVARANGAAADRTYLPAHFDGAAGGIGKVDFLAADIYDLDLPGVRFADPGHASVKRFDLGAGHAVDLAGGIPSPPLEWLWAKAKAEWR